MNFLEVFSYHHKTDMNMTRNQLTPKAIMELAQAEAERLANNPEASAQSSQALHGAVTQAWELVRQRLGSSPEVDELDRLIKQVTQSTEDSAD